MKSLRALSLSFVFFLASALAFSQGGLLDKKPHGNGGGSSQGSGSSGSSNQGGNKPSGPPPSSPSSGKPSGPPPSSTSPNRPSPPPSSGGSIQPSGPRPGGSGSASGPSSGPSSSSGGQIGPLPPSRPHDERPPRVYDKPKSSGGDNSGNRPRGNDDLLGPRRGGAGPNGNNGIGGGQRSGGNDDIRIYNPPSKNDGDRLGRIERQSSRPSQQDDNLLGKRGNSTIYGSSNNNLSAGGQRSGPIEINRAPVDIFRGGLPNQVLREERVHVRSSCRSGYYSYYNNWCDSNFFFGFYVFDPYRYSNCYVSPWYYYPNLPGYVNSSCCHVVSISLDPWYGSAYNWRRPSYGYGNSYDSYRDTSPLDYALDDIVRAWEQNDRRSMERLIPYRDDVAIFVDGQYSYSMQPEKFEDFLLDAIEGTRTLRYEITHVERRGREAEVDARHEYEDPWGRRTTVYHHYRLEEYRGNYVITRFGTSYNRDW